jgi:hypothetical protein
MFLSVLADEVEDALDLLYTPGARLIRRALRRARLGIERII